VLGGDAKRPFGVGLVRASGGIAEYIYPDSIAAGFPLQDQVVRTRPHEGCGGLEIHNQMFCPGI